jgi:Ni/Fe-hydrogenase subunit HybB-like protein
VWSLFWDHPVIHQWACTLAAGTAVVAPSTLGAVFGVLVARPFWHGLFTPVLMVASAFLAGTALLSIVFYAVGRLRLAGFERANRVAIPSLRLLLGIGLVVVSALVARQMIAGLVGNERGLRAATEAVLAGPLAGQFWVLRIGLGLVLPLLLVVLPGARTSRGLFVAAIGALCGVFADRLLLVSGGEIAPTTVSAGVLSSPYAVYTPSLVEIGIVIGAGAFVAFAYTLAELYLDLNESDVHFGFPVAQLIRRGYRLVASAIRVVSPLGDEPASVISSTEATSGPEPDDQREGQTEPVPGGVQ